MSCHALPDHALPNLTHAKTRHACLARFNDEKSSPSSKQYVVVLDRLHGKRKFVNVFEA
jgi:hypothetical protein